MGAPRLLAARNLEKNTLTAAATTGLTCPKKQSSKGLGRNGKVEHDLERVRGWGEIGARHDRDLWEKGVES